MDRELDGEMTIDLLEVFNMLLQRILLILLCTAAAAAAGFCVTRFAMEPQYEASAMMIVNTRQDANANVTSDQLNSASKLVSTYSIIIKSDTVLSRVINEMGLNLNYDELNKKVTVTSVDSTQVMRISVRDGDPAIAQMICQKITEVSPDLIKDAVEAGSVKVISAAAASMNPVSPSVVKNTALAGLVGFVACVGVLVLKMLLNNKINSDSDVEKYLGLPVLGVIPVYEGE